MDNIQKPARYAFDCVKCFKSLQLEERVYLKAYAGHTLCLSCRPVVEVPVEGMLEERNRLLVLENDELLADNMLRRNYESFLKSVIMGREHLPEEHDFEWFKKKWRSIKKPESEELK